MWNLLKVAANEGRKWEIPGEMVKNAPQNHFSWSPGPNPTTVPSSKCAPALVILLRTTTSAVRSPMLDKMEITQKKQIGECERHKRLLPCVICELPIVIVEWPAPRKGNPVAWGACD